MQSRQGFELSYGKNCYTIYSSLLSLLTGVVVKILNLLKKTLKYLLENDVPFWAQYVNSIC